MSGSEPRSRPLALSDPEAESVPVAPRLTRGRLFLFRAVALLIAPLLLLFAELAVRLASAPSPDPFVHLSAFTLFQPEEIDGARHLRITHSHAYPERGVTFPVGKAPRTIRIFTLGGSAAAGWPLPPEEAFTAHLEAMLRESLSRPVEVINAAAHGFPSYRVRQVFDQVVELDPDAIVVYSGNNELLEARSYGVVAPDSMVRLGQRLRTVDLLRRHAIERQTRLSGQELNEVAAALWQMVQRQATTLRSDPAAFARVQEHYAHSVRAMVRKGERQEVPVLLLTVPSNLRDWRPTVSHVGLLGEQLSHWEELVRAGRRSLLEGEPEAAAVALEQALALEPEHAESWYWRARAAEAKGETETAYLAYRRAKDQDYNPFRAHSQLNEALRGIAAEHTGAWLVDLELLFRQAALGPAPGFDLFLDYVHPTRQGNLLVASAVFQALATSGALGVELPPDPPALPPSAYRAEADFQLQMRLFGLCTMTRQYEAALQRGLQIVRLVSGELAPSPGSRPPPPALPPAVAQALELFPRYLHLEEQDLLGIAVPPERRSEILGAVEAFYETWYQYLRE